MKVYEVVPEFSDSSHVVIAKNEQEAIDLIVNYLNQLQTSHSYESSDFCASCINGDKFSEPVVIN